MGSKIRHKYDNISRIANWNLNKNGLTGGNTGPVQYFDSKFTRVGSDNPLWRSRVKKGLSACNYMQVSAYNLERFVEPWVAIKGVYKKDASYAGNINLTAKCAVFPTGQLPYPATTLPSAQRISLTKDEAATGILKRIQEETQAVSGFVFLGELRESLHMIRHPANALAKHLNTYVEKLRKVKRVKPQSLSKTIADTWLEWSLGAAPFIGDISKIAEASLRLQDDCITRLSFQSTNKSATTSSLSTYVGNMTGIQFLNEICNQNNYSHRFTVGYHRECTMNKTPLQRIISMSDFNLSAIIPAAWELLPWSFFIDYFSNIGDVISASCTSFENVRWAYETTRVENRIKYFTKHVWETGTSNGIYRLSAYMPLLYEAKHDLITRQTAVIPFPELRFSLPGRRNQFFNMAALLRSIR